MARMTDGARFPEGFLWGAATSAYQVEGSPLADGAGPSIWHRFAHTPGLVAGGDTGDVACDHYRRFRDDVALMKDLGLAAYRFSISWSRVLPQGTGAVNERGLDFYRKLVDALLAAGIAPSATLFHWDLPAALEDRGGWLNPESVGWFARYASVAFRALDGVALWATLNEPWVVTDARYLHGILAPGHRDLFETPIAAHNLLRAHAEAVRVHRAEGSGRIGLVVNIEPKYPASSDPRDIDATLRADVYMNRQFLDPVLLGAHPEELPALFGEAWPAVGDADLELMKEPLDFLGVNYYTRAVVRHDEKARPFFFSPVRQERASRTEMDWEIYPDGLFDTLVWIKERYGDVPLYVTENGAAFDDPPPDANGVADAPRIAYFADHLRAARRAIAAGVDLRGYFAWSLFDNFEWSHGFSKRFGLVHVDLETQRRTPKASARFYADVIRSHGASLS
jgi:beta-glucosidase